MKTTLLVILSVVSVGAFASGRIQLKSGSSATILANEETEVSCENTATVNPAPPCIVIESPIRASYWQVALHSNRISVDGRNYSFEKDAKEALREHRASGICR